MTPETVTPETVPPPRCLYHRAHPRVLQRLLTLTVHRGLLVLPALSFQLVLPAPRSPADSYQQWAS